MSNDGSDENISQATHISNKEEGFSFSFKYDLKVRYNDKERRSNVGRC